MRKLSTDYKANSGLRVQVYQKFKDQLTIHTLSELLGFNNFSEMRNGFTEDNINTCKLLLGPNGHTVWKAMQARKQDAVVVE